MTVKTLIGVLVIIVFVGGFAYIVVNHAHELEVEKAKHPLVVAPNFSRVICDEGFKTPSKDSADKDVPNVSVDLPGGCFSAIITLPSSWRRWSYQHAPDMPQADRGAGWVSFWYSGMEPTPPMPIDDDGTLASAYTGNKVRVEGKGKIIFFRTDQ